MKIIPKHSSNPRPVLVVHILYCGLRFSQMINRKLQVCTVDNTLQNYKDNYSRDPWNIQLLRKSKLGKRVGHQSSLSFESRMGRGARRISHAQFSRLCWPWGTTFSTSISGRRVSSLTPFALAKPTRWDIKLHLPKPIGKVWGGGSQFLARSARCEENLGVHLPN